MVKPEVEALIPLFVIYFVVAAVLAFFVMRKGKTKLNAIDWAIIGVGGALIAIADHVVGDAIFLPSGIYPIVNPPVWFRIFVFFIVAAVVRKVGVGMASMAVYDIVSDLIHFSFAGEPLWIIEDVLTYGLMIDVAVLLTKGKLFGIGVKSFALFAIAEGMILGFLFSFVHPFFTYGFIAPIVFGFVPNHERVMYLLLTYIPGDVFIGAVSAIVANRVAKVIR